MRPAQRPESASPFGQRGYRRFLLLVAGLGGLLYGIDLGIIGGALPYLEATSKLSAAELSVVVAAVLLGSVLSTLFAGLLADWMGRKPLMVLSGLAFVASIPVIALSHGFAALCAGRLLQGISAGFIGIVVPLYLAECLEASVRGKGTGVFQWLLTFGIVAAALVGIYFSFRVEAVARAASAAELFAFKDSAWRCIFWVSLPPGLLFVLGALLVGESPRWLFRRGKCEQAHDALLRSRSPEEAARELRAMEAMACATAANGPTGRVTRDSLLQRKYLFPFLLACTILFCNTATGVNSIISYNTTILLESGLSDLAAHWGYVLFTVVNFGVTMAGMTLVDRLGRRLLLIVGIGGILVSQLLVGVLFRSMERQSIDCRSDLQAEVTADQQLRLRFDPATARQFLASAEQSSPAFSADHATLTIIYSYGDFTAVTNAARSDDPTPRLLNLTRASCLPSTAVEAFFKKPFGNLARSRNAPLHIVKALLGTVPDANHGWRTALCLYGFIAFYGLGPGVCVWLALSELMPTRIRSIGMSIALVLNQLVSTMLAGVFLPFVGKYGYSSMFFLYMGFTLIYFFTVVFLLPETKGRTLEEIEAYFANSRFGGPRS